MKNVLFLFVACLVINSLQAQEPAAAAKKPTQKSTSAKPKAAQISDNSSTTAIPTPVTTSKAAKVHVCAKACVEGKHVYVHGESGHTCGTTCKNAPKKAKAQTGVKQAEIAK